MQKKWCVHYKGHLIGYEHGDNEEAVRNKLAERNPWHEKEKFVIELCN